MTGDWSGSDNEAYDALREQAKRGLAHGRAGGVNKVLENEHDHAVAMSKDTSIPAKERETWKAMAHELATRLGYNAPPSKQEELF